MAKVDNSTCVLKILQDLFSNEELFDIELKVGTSQFKTHKLVLCMRSDVFKTMLTSGVWPESRYESIVLQEEAECEPVFKQFLTYLYSGQVVLKNTSVLPLLMLADKYNIPDLSKSCLHFMSVNCLPESREYIMAWLQYTILCGNKEVEQICLDFIINNFVLFIDTRAFINLNKGILIELLKSSELVVNSEYQLYKAASKWLLHNRSTTDNNNDTFYDVMKYIRFAMMQLQQLSELETDQFLKSHENFFLQRIFSAIKYHTSANSVFRSSKISGKLFVCDYQPRNYQNEMWTTVMRVEDFSQRRPGEVCGAFFTTPVSYCERDQHNLRDWHLHLYPKGIQFDPFIMIGAPSSRASEKSFEKNIRLSVTANLEVKQSVDIIVLVVCDRDGQEQFVCRVVKRRAFFDADSPMFNINHIVPYDDLVCPDSKFLVSKNDEFKLVIIIKPDVPFFDRQQNVSDDRLAAIRY